MRRHRVEVRGAWRGSLAMLALVARGEADVAAGRVVTQAEAFRRAELAIARGAAQPGRLP